MTSKSEKDRAKQIQDKCQQVLNDLLRDEDNKYCVDCDTKGPRWASWNIGVFLCIRCAGIHRNLGVHISKVKSVNLDTWTPEQVVSLQQMGNSRARAVYEANLPDHFRRPQNDSSLESFVRAKYEHKKYIAREWVPPALPKVNWEKEIDEEIERQKRKKKQMNSDKRLSSGLSKTIETPPSAIPQIPKPKGSSSPKPNRITTNDSSGSPASTAAEKSSKNVDLLGLDQNGTSSQNNSSGDDSFSNFLSGPAAWTNKEDDKSVAENAKVQSEEESFFNQPAPTEKEKTKLTKDSILALYGNSPMQQTTFQANYAPTGPIPGFPVQQQAFQVPVYPTNFQASSQPQQAFQNQPAFVSPPQNQFVMAQQTMQTQNFAPNFASQTPQQQTFQQNPVGFNSAFNQFQMSSNQNQFVNSQQFTPQFQSTQFQNATFAPNTGATVPNPFYANQQALQQQFANISLGASTVMDSSAGKPTPALSTANVWQ